MNERTCLIARILIVACTLCVGGMVFAADSAQPEAATEKKDAPSATPSEQLKRIHYHMANFLPGRAARDKKAVTLPEAASVVCGEFRSFAGERTKACITRSAKEGPWEKVIVDLNGNSDLTDDQVLDLPATRDPGKIVFEHNGIKHAYVATMMHAKAGGLLRLHRDECWSGTTDFAGNKTAWMACDCNLSGSLDAGDMMYLDGDGNGKVGERGIDSSVRLGPDALLVADGKWFTLSATEENNVSATPYKGAMATWTVDDSKIVDEKDTPHTFTFYVSVENQVVLKDVKPASGLVLPSRTYRYASGAIMVKPKPIQYSISNLQLKADATLVLEKPVSKVSVSQTKGKISVNQKISTPHGVNYYWGRDKKGPLVEVFTESQPDKPVATGNMEYG